MSVHATSSPSIERLVAGVDSAAAPFTTVWTALGASGDLYAWERIT